MKFLKCFVAYKGGQYTAYNNRVDNQNMANSFIMRPGDYFDLVQINYMGYHHVNEYNTPAYRTGTYTKGDFFGRTNGYNFTEQTLMVDETINNFPMIWRIVCCGDNNDNIWLEIYDANTHWNDHAMAPITRVDHCRQIDRIHALQSLIERANNGSWDLTTYNQPVPNYQYGNSNGIIRTPKLFYHKTDCHVYGASNEPAFASNAAKLRVGPHLYSGAGTDLAQSLIDLEKRIGIFLGTVGCTISAMNPNGGTLTSDYHSGTAHCPATGNLASWCGGIKATPLRSDVTAAQDTWYGDEVLSIVRGAGIDQRIYNGVIDDKNNLSGWCIPQAREQMINGSSNTTALDTNYGQQYRAGIFNQSGNYKYFMTSIMGIAGGDVSHAYQDLTFPSTFNNNLDTKDWPPLCIINSYQTLINHCGLRWGYLENNNWSHNTDGSIYCTLYSYGGGDHAFSLRDIQAGTPASQTDASMGTYGSFGIIVSTFDTQTGAVNNANQVFTPIHCLITPSIMSDFPALDIYGIRKRRTEQGSSFVTSYIQSESCFKYALKDFPDLWGPIIGGQYTRATHYVSIFKTINTSTPDVVEYSEFIGDGGGILPVI